MCDRKAMCDSLYKDSDQAQPNVLICGTGRPIMCGRNIGLSEAISLCDSLGYIKTQNFQKRRGLGLVNKQISLEQPRPRGLCSTNMCYMLGLAKCSILCYLLWNNQHRLGILVFQCVIVAYRLHKSPEQAQPRPSKQTDLLRALAAQRSGAQTCALPSLGLAYILMLQV